MFGLAIVVAALLGPVQNQPDAAEVASRIAADLARPPFALSTHQWRQLVISADWREHRGADASRGTGVWCMVATDRELGAVREARFYAFRPAKPLACRLEEVHYVAPGDDARKDEVYAALLGRLSREMGKPQSSDPERPHGRGSGWAQVRGWNRGTSFLWLYRTTEAVGVFARHFLLEYGGGESFELPPSFLSFGHASNTWDAANLLWPYFPAASDLMLDRQAIPDQDAVLRAAITLFRSARRFSTMEMRGAVAIGLQVLLAKLWIEGETAPLLRPEYAALRRFDVKCEYDGHGGGWECGTGLLDRFLGEYPHSRWSHRRYLESLGQECEGVGYTEVIEKGIPWLRRHRGSEFEPFVTAAIAQAYETWWSLSLAPADEEFVTAAEHAAGAGRARELAIDWYHRLQQQYPESIEATLSGPRANQLQIGIDTAQRRYYCVIP